MILLKDLCHPFYLIYYLREEEYFSAMEHKVIPAYVKGRLAPTLGKSREDSEQLTKILLALSFLVYFSADDDVAVMAFRAFCDVDDLVDEIHDSEVDFAPTWRHYFSSTLAAALPFLHWFHLPKTRREGSRAPSCPRASCS